MNLSVIQIMLHNVLHLYLSVSYVYFFKVYRLWHAETKVKEGIAGRGRGRGRGRGNLCHKLCSLVDIVIKRNKVVADPRCLVHCDIRYHRCRWRVRRRGRGRQ